MTQLAGTTWMTLYPQLHPAARAVAQRQIGRAAGRLHALRFDAFGQIGAAGSVMNGTTAVPALIHRARQRLTTTRYLGLFLEVLDEHRDLFARLSTPTLCHEDLNPNNLVFQVRDGLPELERLLREGRAAAQELRELSSSLRENPSQLLYQPKQVGVEIPR